MAQPYKLSADVDPAEFGSTETFRKLLTTLAHISSIVQVKRFRFTPDPPVAERYRYLLELDDGRTWEQALTFDVATDPKMTFDVSDGWRLSEFSTQRPLRDLVVEARSKHAVTKIDVKIN